MPAASCARSGVFPRREWKPLRAGAGSGGGARRLALEIEHVPCVDQGRLRLAPALALRQVAGTGAGAETGGWHRRCRRGLQSVARARACVRARGLPPSAGPTWIASRASRALPTLLVSTIETSESQQCLSRSSQRGRTPGSDWEGHRLGPRGCPTLQVAPSRS